MEPALKLLSASPSRLSRSDSLRKHVVRIEELLGIFQFAFWKVYSEKAVQAIVCFFCGNLSYMVSKSDVTDVQRLHYDFPRVILQVLSLELKQLILFNSEIFKFHWFLVTTDWMCVFLCIIFHFFSSFVFN